MTEALVGRLLPACLHQAILDEIPQRLDFYEEWLHPDGLRDGNIGLAPLTAVLGFLRTEGEAYGRVMTRAGTLAGEWSIAAMPAVRRRLVTSLPRGLRARAALRIAARIVRDVLSTSKASTRMRRGHAKFSIDASLFCAVRDRHAAPLCGFYAALGAEVLRRFDLPAGARIEACRAVSGGACVVDLNLSGAVEAPGPAMAA